MHRRKYTSTEQVSKGLTTFNTNLIRAAALAWTLAIVGIGTAAILLASGCLKSNSEAKTVVLLSPGTPVLLIQKVNVEGAAENPPGSGNWESVGRVELPMGYVCFAADLKRLDGG